MYADLYSRIVASASKGEVFREHAEQRYVYPSRNLVQYTYGMSGYVWYVWSVRKSTYRTYDSYGKVRVDIIMISVR